MMNCGLNSSQIGQLYQLAFKRLSLAKQNNIAFDLKKLMKDVYDHRMSKGYGEVDAVTFAQQIPALVDKAAAANPELKAHLRSYKFSLDQLADDVMAIDESITKNNSVPFMMQYLNLTMDVAKDLRQANEALKEDAKNKEVTEEEIKPTVEIPIPISTDFASTKITDDTRPFKAATPSMLTDRGQEALSKERRLADGSINPNFNVPNPYLKFYYNVKYKILRKMLEQNKSDSSEINIPGIGGVYIRIQSSSTIPEKDLKPLNNFDKFGNPIAPTEEWLKEMKEANDKGVVMVLVDSDGYPIRFNEAGDPDYKGKIAYYNLRVPYYRNGEIHLTEDDLRSIEARSNQKNEKPDVARAFIIQELKYLDKVREYIKKNPSENHLTATITGGSLGYTQFDYKTINTPIKAINFGSESFKPHPLKIEGRTGTSYFFVEGMHGKPIEIERPTIASVEGMVDKLVSILTDRLIKTNALGQPTEPATYGDLREYLEAFYHTKEETLRIYDDGTVKLKGRALDLSSPEGVAKSKEILRSYFTELGPQREVDYNKLEASQKVGIISTSDDDYQDKIKDPANLGKILKQYDPSGGPAKYFVIEYPKVMINDKLLSKDSYNDVTLLPQEDGTVLVKNNFKPYIPFIKDNFTIHYELNSENKLLRLNGYFNFETLAEQNQKINPKNESVQKIKDETASKNTATGSGPADKSSKDLIKGVWDDPDLKNKLQKSQNAQATLEQMEAAKTWYENHPLSKHFPFEIMFNAINTARPNGIASWTVQGITLFKGSDFTDLYHEAWHGFTQTFLTQAQRTNLYKEARGLTGSFKDFNGDRVAFARASEKQLEEYLAEDFQSYMVSGKVKPAAPVRNKIFQMILDFFKALYNDLTYNQVVLNDKANRTIHELYEKMRVGNLTEYNFNAQNTTFNELNKGIERIVDTEPQDFLNYEESTRLVDTMDSLISEFVDASNSLLDDNDKLELAALNDKNRRGVKLTEEEASKLLALESRRTYRYTSTLIKTKKGRLRCYGYIETRLAEIHNDFAAQLKVLTDKDTLTDEEKVKKTDLEATVETLAWAVRNFGNTEDFSKNKKGKGLIGYHIVKSKFFPVEDKEAMLDEMSEEEKTDRTGYDKSGNEMALKDLASKEILYLLRSLHKRDKNGDTTPNAYNVPELAPFDQVWNRLARLLQNTLSIDEMHRLIDTDSKNFPPFRQLLLKLGPINTTEPNEFELWTNFWQSFNKTSVPLIQMTVDATTKDDDKKLLLNPEYSVTIGDAVGSHHKIQQRWSSYFRTTRTSKYIRPGEGNVNVLDVPRLLEDFNSSNLAGRELEFFSAIGIVLDDIPEIRKELAKGEGGAKYILNTIKNVHYDYNEPITDIGDIFKKKRKDIVKGNFTIYGSRVNNARLTELSRLQSRYSDEHADFSVTNAEGNQQFEHTLNNTLTVIVNSINSSKNYQSLIALPHMSYLDMARNPFVEASTWMNSIYHLKDAQGNLYEPTHELFGTKRKQTTDRNSPDVKITINNLSGVAMKQDGDFSQGGIASASADEYTKLILDLHLTLEGKPELMRHADKGTSFSAWLSNIITQGHSKKLYVDTESYITASGQGLNADQTAEVNVLIDSIKRGQYPEKAGYTRLIELLRINATSGFDQAFNIIVPHISSELKRINYMNNIKSNMPLEGFDFEYMERGKEFVTFDRALSENTKAKLKKLTVPLTDYLKEKSEESNKLNSLIYDDLLVYFEMQTKEVRDLLDKVKTTDKNQYFLATSTLNGIQGQGKNKFGVVTEKMAREGAIKSFMFNSWIHNLESLVVLYGDLAQYKIAKEEFHKRNAGIGSTGNIYRTDQAARDFINKIGRPYTKQNGGRVSDYNGIFNTAVVADNQIGSKYIDEYKESIGEDIRSRLSKRKGITEKEITDAIDNAVDAYTKMDEGDAQGWISFDAYRILLNAEGKWTKEHDALYNRIVNENYKPEHHEVAKFFPTQKLQYWGQLKTSGIPIIAFHKFSLFPLIPTVIEGKNLDTLHKKMMNEGIDYALFKTGSKIGNLTHDGVTDPFYTNKTDRVISDKPFVPNRIYLEYLKNQLEIAPDYKKNVVFSTQMRKLIEDGLVEGGIPTDFKSDEPSLDKRRKLWRAIKDETAKRKESKRYDLLKRYEDNINKLTELKKEELLKEINWKMNSNGKLEGSLDDLMKFVKNELTRQDLSDHEVDFINVNPKTGKLENDLSLSLSADKIERLLNAIVIKRLVRQKVNGEGLIQVSGAGFENPSDVDKDKWGSGDLPTYHKGKDGTNAMKVKIALQGQFVKLLEAKHNDGERIGTRERLNQMLKNEEWLNKEDHRRMITMVGVRIPVQGLNSMEFMEVHEFLPTEAGNIIVPPAEIVAKSGSDFDIDKLTVMMPTYQKKDGNITIARGYSREEAKVIYQEYKKKKIERADEELVSYANEMDWDVETILNMKGDIKTFDQFYALLTTTKAIENDLIWNIKEILSLPENYVKLIRPNGTDLVKGMADDLSTKVMDYNPKDKVFKSEGKGVTGTRVLEIQYNLYKHSSNNIGKQTLGLGAVDNTYNSLFNRIGAYMNPTVGLTTAEYNRLKAKKITDLTDVERKKLNKFRVQTLHLPHNTLDVDGEQAISLSHLLDKNGENYISDVISQLINGWVDIAKDAWIFNIQGNKEIAPTLLFMIQAGVPLDTAIYLVSQPLVREYVRQQKLSKSTFAGPLGKAPSNPMYFRSKALEFIMGNPQFGFNVNQSQLKGGALQSTAYTEGQRLIRQELKGGEFDKDTLYKDIKSTTYDDHQRAAFLHFIEIENMAKAVRDVKMRMNVDTTKDATLFEAQNRMLMIEELREDGRIPVSIVDDILNNTPISSFYIQPFQLEIWKDLFILRDHPELNKFLIDKFRSGIIDDIDATYGDSEKFASEFRNDLMSYIFQNTINNFDIKNVDSYQGYKVSTDHPVTAVKSLSIGAFVANNKLYVDKPRLSKLFNDKLYAKAIDATPFLTKEGPAIVEPAAFTTANEYYHFVFERESLRSLYTFKNTVSTNEFENYSKSFSESIPQLEGESKANYDTRKMGTMYEMWLRDKALDNVYNGWKLFESKDTYADQFIRLYDEFPELKKNYSLMNSIVLSSTQILGTKTKSGRPGYTNLRLADNKVDGDRLNVLHENLLALSNSTTPKVANEENNQRISDFFKRFATVAFLQSGLNTKNSFSMIRMVPQDDFLRLMKKPADEFTKHLNPVILQDFYNKFVRENNIINKSKRIRYKNYISNLTLDKSIGAEKETKVQTNVITPYDDNIDVFDTSKLGVAVAGQKAAAKLMNDNPDSYFVYNGATEAQGNAVSQDFIFAESKNLANKLGFPTMKKYTGNESTYADVTIDGVVTIDPEFKKLIDSAVTTLREIQNSGKKLVFNKDGYGQYLAKPLNGKFLGAQSFLYLSKELFNNFGYVNPTYLTSPAGRKVVQAPQDISDETVRDFMNHCFL